jgi:hypothetical protein
MINRTLPSALLVVALIIGFSATFALAQEQSGTMQPGNQMNSDMMKSEKKMKGHTKSRRHARMNKNKKSLKSVKKMTM